MFLKFFKPLFSNRLTLVLLLGYALTMAVATFLENDFGTQAVVSLVYRSWWFEAIQALLALNFIGNVWKYRLYRKEKWSVLLFHLAFVVILVGAFVTRYTGFEGLMNIREGETSREVISQNRYLTVEVKKEDYAERMEQPLALSLFKQPTLKWDLGEEDEILLQTQAFVPQAEQRVVASERGTAVIKLVTTEQQSRKDLYLPSGGVVLVNNFPVSFDRPLDGAINIFSRGEGLHISAPFDMNFMVMATQTRGALPADSLMPLRLRALYQNETLSFVVPEVYQNSSVVYAQAKDMEKAKALDDLLFVKLTYDGRSREVTLPAFDGNESPSKSVDLGDYQLQMSYGPKPVALPFALQLIDFQLERYPGSSSPSSFASEVQVVDEGASFPYRIYMNHVLDYRGYRFFQSSYNPDEKGTILSVNQDWWGTSLSYLGYCLMGLGMLLTLFGRRSRFRFISEKLRDLNAQKLTMTCLLFLFFGATCAVAHAYTPGHAFDYHQYLRANVIDEAHASGFGELLVQDFEGRIKPINSLSSEFLRKVYGRSSFQFTDGKRTRQLSSDQVFLMLHVNPLVWQQVPIIKIHKSGGTEILKMLGQEGAEYLTLLDFFDAKGNYLLKQAVEQADLKKPAERDVYDKALIHVDERFNVLFQALSGRYLKIFPKADDPAQTWYSDRFESPAFQGEDSVFVRKILPLYYQSLLKAGQDSTWVEAEEVLGYIQIYQQKQGEGVIPPESVQKAELLYNKLKLFNRFYYLWLLGVLSLVVAILRVFQPHRRWVVRLKHAFTLAALACFLALTFNLILRWYAAGHAPWSNGYEMIILVAWALMLFGFVFYRQSDFVIPLSLLFSGTLLFVAFLDWLNPEITNLVPVLKSYWLKIHVAIIVSSYAPLGLSALLGLMTLVFMILDKNQNPRLSISMKEMTYINEMSMTLGVFLLAIGTFLGGVWANESWGRYWGWDPKETWALISVIVYAFVLHLRLVPKLNNLYVFNVASVISFFSIMMTSFGVNYYLSGLHSYAKGDPVPIPTFVYWTVAVIVIICLWAYAKQKRIEAARTAPSYET